MGRAPSILGLVVAVQDRGGDSLALRLGGARRPPKLIGFPMAGWYPASVKRALWRAIRRACDLVEEAARSGGGP